MATQTQPPSSPKTAKPAAHQHVYGRLRQMILFGDLAPGQAVTIQGLVGLLDAGMTPVREALRRLIAEGALIQHDNRRVVVPQLTRNCTQELDFMRKTLEPELAARAASRITKAGLDQLVATDENINLAIQKGDISAYLKQNYEFHRQIYQIADAPIIAATVDRLWIRFGPSLRVVCGRFGTQNLPDKHVDLLRALSDRNSAAASQAMCEDVSQGMNQICETLD